MQIKFASIPWHFFSPLGKIFWHPEEELKGKETQSALQTDTRQNQRSGVQDGNIGGKNAEMCN